MGFPKNTKKTRNGNLLVEAGRKHTKKKMFLTTKCTKDITLLKELSEVGSRPWQQQRCQQSWENREWQTSVEYPWENAKNKSSTYILTFDIVYCLKRVEKCVPVPLRCFNCQKFGHYRKACIDWHVQSKVKKDPDYMMEDCLKEIRCPNCQQTIWLTLNLVTWIKKKREYLR